MLACLPISHVICATLLLGGCASAQGIPALPFLNSDNSEQNARFNGTVFEGTATGAGLGGLAGSALGIAQHRRSGGVGTTAAIGVVAGGLLGAGTGYMVARNNYNAEKSETNLQKAIDEAENDVATYQKSVQASKQIAREAQLESQRIDEQYQAGQLTASQYRSQLSKYQSDSAMMKRQRSSMQVEADQLRADARTQPANASRYYSLAGQIGTADNELQRSLDQIDYVLARQPSGA